jgi:hypothetical protein
MIRPQPACNIDGSTACASRNGAIRLTVSDRSHSTPLSSQVRPNGPTIAALLTSTAIREQPAEVVGERVAELFQGFYNEGRLQTPDRPARLIAALAGAAGAEFNGQIVDIYGEQGQALLNS